MTRETYINYRNLGKLEDLFYNLYLAECEKRKMHNLEKKSFTYMFNMWINLNNVDPLLKYDIFYKISILYSKDGKIIKYL
jgi:hypothetical protein